MLVNRRQIDLAYYIELAVFLLMSVGTVFVFSAGANIGTDYDLRDFLSFTTLKQLLFFPVAVGLIYLISMVNYQRFAMPRRNVVFSASVFMLALSIILLVLVLIPGIGVEKNFSRRWLALPLGSASLSFQPSELAKWSVVFFLAAFCDRYYETMHKFWTRFVLVCLLPGIVVALIITQDFGTAAFISMLTFIMLVIGGARWWHFLTPLPVVVPGFLAAIVTSETRMNRIKDFLNPDNISYQAHQSLIAISTGGLMGKGIGRGVSKYGHLPEDTTDFIFSIIAEEAGFLGVMVVICLFVTFIIFGIIVVLRCGDRFGRLLAAGIVFTIGIQAAINIGVVTVVLPTKGIPLPFISAGGTSMLLSAAAVGILVNIARQTSRQESDYLLHNLFAGEQ